MIQLEAAMQRNFLYPSLARAMPLSFFVFCAMMNISQYSLTQARKVNKERSRFVEKRLLQASKIIKRLLLKVLLLYESRKELLRERSGVCKELILT